MRCMECDRLSLNPLEFFGKIFLPLVWKKISVGGGGGGGGVYFTVVFDHPSCLLTFCRSGIPTSCYILNVFYYLFALTLGSL